MLRFCVAAVVGGLALGQEETLKKDWCKPDQCYEVLGVEQTAAFREIKARYNNLSMTLHPDKNPNNTDAQKQEYLKIVNAYEILSNPTERRNYDEYLRIRSSMDSPRENILFVLFMLYIMSTGLVYFYDKQKYRHTRKLILEQDSVQEFFIEKHGLDVSGKNRTVKLTKEERRKLEKATKRKRKRKAPAKSRESTPPRQSDEPFVERVKFFFKQFKKLLWSVDPTKDTGYDHVSDEQINEAIEELNLEVPNWKKRKPKPDFRDAAMVVPTFVRAKATSLYDWFAFEVKYTLLKNQMTHTEAVAFCREHFDITEEEWEQLTPKKKKRFMDKPGKWHKCKAKAETDKSEKQD